MQELYLLYGAVDGNRTHEMPEPQSGALTTSPRPPDLVYLNQANTSI